MSTISQRRRPLRELPLKGLFPEWNATTTTRPHKRPLSPGAPNLISPTKRRILEQEGYFSPEKTAKKSTPSSSRYGQPHFGDLVSDPDSLLFETPDIVPGASSFLASIWDLNPPSHCSSLTTIGSSISDGHLRDYLCLPSLSDPGNLIPRPFMSLHEQSTHYPGFDIWRDPDVWEMPSTSASQSVTHSTSDTKPSGEEDKENVAPQKKLQKSVTSPGTSDLQSRGGFLSPEQKRKAVGHQEDTTSGSRTPRLSRIREGSTTPLARFAGVELAPGRPTKVNKDELRWRREMLALEVDGDDDEEDEDEL